MNPPHNPLDGFSPDLYLATLSAVAHADGLHPIEVDLLRQQADTFGVDLDRLPELPEDLSALPWATRVLVYRDALMLAFADADTLSAEEQQYLSGLAEKMRLPSQTTDALIAWVADYGRVLDRFTELMEEPA